jgi:beta-phosphoglucomutase
MTDLLQQLKNKHNLDIKAFIFDLNGTLIDDVAFHTKVWFQLVKIMGKELTYEEMKEECYGRNEDLIERVFPGQYTFDERRKIGYAKEEIYRLGFAPYLKFLPGGDSFIPHFRSIGIKTSIGSAADPFNIDFAVDGLQARNLFDVIVGGHDVVLSKPHPETFLVCADKMGVLPQNCLVFEDVPKGVETAINAGMKSVVLTTTHHIEEFAHLRDHIVAFGPNYQNLTPV